MKKLHTLSLAALLGLTLLPATTSQAAPLTWQGKAAIAAGSALLAGTFASGVYLATDNQSRAKRGLGLLMMGASAIPVVALGTIYLSAMVVGVALKEYTPIGWVTTALENSRR